MTKYVRKLVTIREDQAETVDTHPELNLSGAVQKMIDERFPRNERPKYFYDVEEVLEEMAARGLVPSPFPTLPVEILLPDGRYMRIRHEWSSGVDEEGSERWIVWVHI